MNLVQKYRGGISYGDSFATRELLLRPEWSNEQQLYFESYDANMYPLPDYDKWTELGKQELTSTSLYYGSVIKFRPKQQLTDSIS